MKQYTETQQKIFDKISPMDIPCGIGSKGNACTIAAINLALTGELTDKVPECCSEVIGKWVIIIQDEMPVGMRNSERYKMLVPYIAGTGREPKKEAARLKAILEWLWNTVLPSLQVFADKNSFGEAWQNMLSIKTAAAAHAASQAAYEAAYEAASEAASSAYVANTAYATAYANAANAAYAVACAVDAVNAANVASAAYATWTVAYAVYTAINTARAVIHAVYDTRLDASKAAYAIWEATWETLDPISLLEKLILVDEPV